jgi:Ran GTPase-activating protein (RanGAP) involved in mRNA processing and transport
MAPQAEEQQQDAAPEVPCTPPPRDSASRALLLSLRPPPLSLSLSPLSPLSSLCTPLSSLCIGDLPCACLFAVLTALPVRERAVAACVCTAWRDTLASPAAWADADFGDADGATVTLAAFEAATARAAGRMLALRLPDGCAALRPTAILAAVRANPRLRTLRALGLRLPWSGMLIADALALAPGLMRLEADAFMVEGVPPAAPGEGHAEAHLDAAALDPTTAGGALLHALASRRFACRFLHVAGRLRERGLAVLSSALAGGAHVERLHLAFADMDNGAAGVLAAGMRGAPALADLNLRANRIGAAGGIALAAALTRAPAAPPGSGLRRLCLGSNAIGIGGAAALGAAMTQRGCVLQSLDLTGNGLCPDACAALAAGVTHSATLQTLLLGFNRIGPLGAAALAEALAGAPALTELCVEWNGVGNAGAVALARGLSRRGDTGLRRLGLASNGVADAGAIALGAALGIGAVIDCLSLSNNVRIGDGGAAALACGLSKPSARLQRLELGACGVRAVGATALVHALAVPHTQLRALDISQNAIGADGVAALTRGLRHNAVLAELSLSVHVADAGAAGGTGTVAEISLLRSVGFASLGQTPGPWRGHANTRITF